MSLPADLVKRLAAALLDGFRDDDALDKLIRNVGMHGWVLARAALVTRVDKLIELVDAQGRVLDMLDAALGLAPGNEALQDARLVIFEHLEQARVQMPRVAPHHRSLAAPTPAYASAEVESLSKQLESARTRKQALVYAGLATDEVDRELLRLRRQLREGGQLRAGDTLSDGRYLLIRPVGRGGFAVVWEAHDTVEKRPVAIKVLHQHLATDPQRKERFFRGARVMIDLRHPAVVHVYDPRGEDEAFCYFIMEFVPGGNLRDAVLSKRIAVERVVSLILQVGEALAEAHRRQLIHRDVKPSNILLDERGNAKLTDFDLVGAHDTTGGTRTGALGTFVYAAPECLDKPQEATARADVFGLGMTALFCMSGQDLSIATFRDPEVAVGLLRCPEHFRLVLARAVAWELDYRFADAGAMVDALRGAGEPIDRGPVVVDAGINPRLFALESATQQAAPTDVDGSMATFSHTVDDLAVRRTQREHARRLLHQQNPASPAMDSPSPQRKDGSARTGNVDKHISIVEELGMEVLAVTSPSSLAPRIGRPRPLPLSKDQEARFFSWQNQYSRRTQLSFGWLVVLGIIAAALIAAVIGASCGGSSIRSLRSERCTRSSTLRG